MQSNLIRYKIGARVYFKTKYSFGICKGTVVGLHDDFLRLEVSDSTTPKSVKFEDILSIYDE